MNARLNPTTHAGPTLGHIYMALVNEHMAHSTGGNFVFRAEDNQANWLKLLTRARMTEIACEWLELFDWLEIRVDQVCMQSDEEDECFYAIRHILPHVTERDNYEPLDYPNMDMELYPDAHWLTAEVVWLDHRNGVDCLIAGNDLLSRFSAYRLIEQLFGYKKFPHYYLPRLVDEDGGISKTNGKWQIAEMRDAGWTPSEIRALLAGSCLKDSTMEWRIDNIKSQPKLILAVVR